MINLKEFDEQVCENEVFKNQLDISEAGKARKTIASLLRDKNAEYLAEWIKRSAYKVK